VKGLSPENKNSKIRCKFCSVQQPDMPELRTHISGKHKTEWREFLKQMREYDDERARG
jgi:hypothetical protein